MSNYLKKAILACGIAVFGASNAYAFTLANGTNRAVANNLGEEYRWNSPMLTYAYDESFLNYFGSNGVVAVENAIRMMNAIPNVSTLKTNYPPVDRKSPNLWNFPTRPDRYHARAGNARLLDIKSYALAELFSFMGLGNAEDNAFQLEFGSVTLRNFDPISRMPSKYVNGSLLSFVIVGGTNALPFPIDLMKPVVTLVGASDHRDTRLAEGKFLVAPTRDDIGGLRELYRKDNFNMEPLPPFTYQVVTNEPNLTNPAIFSIDLRWFCKESRTNTPAAFQQFILTNQWWGPAYTNMNIPPLVTLKTNVTWEMGWTTNLTPYLTNFPWTPVGQPDTLVYLTNKYRTFQPSYDYIFGNVITNIHVPAAESEVLHRSWEVVPNAPLWSVIGAVPTTTNYTTTVLNDECPHGEIIILPTTNNLVGYHFTDMMFERVNTLTNLLTPSNNLANPGGALPGQGGGLGAGGAAVTNFVGVMEDEVWQSTNHAYLAYPIVYSTNVLLLGGVEKMRFKHFQPDSWVTTNYSADRFINEYKFPSLEDQTFTFTLQGGAAGGAGGAASFTNAITPSYDYTVDYVADGVKKTGTFIKFFTRPDIIFSALNMPATIATVSTPPASVNNNAINGFQVGGLFGPGNIVTPASGFVIGFNKLGTHWEPLVNRFLNEENMTPGWTWGSFNGSMDEPIVFPKGQTIRDLEAMIFKGD
jgi:hypothetical protein